MAGKPIPLPGFLPAQPAHRNVISVEGRSPRRTPSKEAVSLPKLDPQTPRAKQSPGPDPVARMLRAQIHDLELQIIRQKQDLERSRAENDSLRTEMSVLSKSQRAALATEAFSIDSPVFMPGPPPARAPRGSLEEFKESPRVQAKPPAPSSASSAGLVRRPSHGSSSSGDFAAATAAAAAGDSAGSGSSSSPELAAGAAPVSADASADHQAEQVRTLREDLQRAIFAFEEKSRINENLIASLKEATFLHSHCDSDLQTLTASLSAMKKTAQAAEARNVQLMAEMAHLRAEREHERAAIEAARKQMQEELYDVRQAKEQESLQLRAIIEQDRLKAQSHNENVVQGVWKTHLSALSKQHDNLVSLMHQVQVDATRSREEAKDSIDDIKKATKIELRRSKAELAEHAAAQAAAETSLRDLHEAHSALSTQHAAVEKRAAALANELKQVQDKLYETNQTLDRVLLNNEQLEKRVRDFKDYIKKLELSEKQQKQKAMETIDSMVHSGTDLQALQLVRGGILQKTLSLAVSDDVLTRTKARSALAQFVREHSRDTSTDRQLSEALAAVERIQNWMVKVESAVVDPQIAKDAEACIKAAQTKLMAMEPVVGCRFNTTPTREGWIEMIHIIHGRAAYSAGLRDGDFISRVNGRPTNSREAFRSEVGKARPGESITVQAHRNGGSFSIEITVEARGYSIQQINALRRIASGVLYSSDIDAWKNGSEEKKDEKYVTDVFLGGSCNPTQWRKEVAMPFLEENNVSFYNPQVDDWKPELVEIEARAKRDSRILLFVIDNRTRAIGGMLEAAEYIGCGRKVVLVILNIEPGMSFGNIAISEGELKDLNRARSYLADVAHRHGTPCFKDVKDAVQQVIDIAKGRLSVPKTASKDNNESL